MSDHIAHLLFSSGAILLFAGAPFYDDTSTLVYHRTGLKNLVFGKILYILLASAIYVVYINLISVLSISAVIQWRTTWDGWSLFTDWDIIGNHWLVFNVSQSLLTEYSAPLALVYSAMLEWLNLSFLGLVAYMFNSVGKHSFGTFLAVIMMTLDMGLQNLLPLWLLRISPLSLSMLVMPNEYGWLYPVSSSYVIGFFSIGILIIGVGCYIVEAFMFHKKGVYEPCLK